MIESIIKTYPRYTVSDHGDIFSTNFNKTGKKKIMKPAFSGDYLSVDWLKYMV